MIQDIAPHKLFNEFRFQAPKPSDYLIVFYGEKTLLKKVGDHFEIPRFSDLASLAYSKACVLSQVPCHYLLSIDEDAYFLLDDVSFVVNETGETVSAPMGYEFVGNRVFRTLESPLERLGGATSAHIAKWESLNCFCGRCGSKMERGTRERSVVCPACKNTVYPRISPVVIVAVHNGDELLMARNLDHPDKSRLFLISGFVEIGESLEQAVAREVMEEAGIRVKNVRYFGSQPWPFSESLISGYTAELDGDATLKIQESEIETACWVKRADIPPYDTSVSISSALIENFRTQV